MKARQIIVAGMGRVELREVELTGPAQGQILVEMGVSALSPGTERAFALGLEGTPREWPRTTGYSQVGRVVEAGEGANIPAGSTVHVMNEHASAVIAAAESAVVVPDGVPEEHAAFLTMLAIATQGIRKARIEIGERVLVIGAGLIGQLAAQIAFVAGASQVLIADISEHRLKLAADCGLATPIDLRTDSARGAIENSGPYSGPNVVVEATGAPGPILDAFRFAGRLARVVLLGSTRGTAENVDFYSEVHKKGLVVIGAHNSIRPQHDNSPGYWGFGSDARACLSLLEAGRLRLDPLITDRFPAREFADAYDRMFEWDETQVGVLLRWT